MCEWLSCEEWCDVFLLCGGRVFSAHRAVLASVSMFLRKILLACPDDETPTFIVMPEFDFETMSSVLHYIYNGEVAIDSHQVETFLDIVNALQVFVDTRDLIKSKLNHYNFNGYENTLKKENAPLSGNYVTLKKEVKKNCNVRFSYDKKKLDQSYLDANCFKSQKIQSGYLKSLEDRQSQPFSRDLFIETYSLNRNGNGVTEGVLTISNERYHEPASLLKTNANTEHLREVHTETDKKDSVDSLNSLYNKEHSEFSKKKYLKGNTFMKSNKISEDTHACNTPGTKNNSISSLNLDTKNLQDTVPKISAINKEFSRSKESINRVAIHNEVLQNPWRPRLSLTFTPFPKKCINRKPEKDKKLQFRQNGSTNNDKNNNNNRSTKNEHNENEATNMIEMKRNVLKDVQADTKEEHTEAHKSARYTCTECYKSFSQLRNYKYHMSVHRGTKEFATTCPVCGKFFNDKGYLSSHMKIHRNRKEYKCSLCPKSFNQRVAYNMHMRIHTGVKPHVCDECGKAFSRKMLLKQHQRTHSGERPYACQHCNKRFADRSNMTLHLRLHTGVKPFACSLCPKSFTKKHHLKSHLNFHTGDKPYTCPRCKLAFTQSSNMRTHMKKCNVHKD